MQEQLSVGEFVDLHRGTADEAVVEAVDFGDRRRMWWVVPPVSLCQRAHDPGHVVQRDATQPVGRASLPVAAMVHVENEDREDDGE